MIRGFVHDTLRAAVDLVYPPNCQGCNKALAPEVWHHERLCDACQNELWPCAKPCCDTCGEPFRPDDSATFTCQTCHDRNFAFEFAVAAYQSRGLLRELIHRFKYHRQLFLRPLLGQLMLKVNDDARLAKLNDHWLAVPVPLHHRRYREREFNQADELSRVWSKASGVPTVLALKRTRYTSSQTRYRRDQRMANLRGAFTVRKRCQPSLQDKSVLLVDDVFTTGSTAHECAGVLRDAGAKKVVVITLARG